MLEEQITAFNDYCKVTGFKDQFFEPLSVRLKEFNKFVRSPRISHIQTITYRHLQQFVADYKRPSLHVKKVNGVIIGYQIDTSIRIFGQDNKIWCHAL